MYWPTFHQYLLFTSFWGLQNTLTGGEDVSMLMGPCPSYILITRITVSTLKNLTENQRETHLYAMQFKITLFTYGLSPISNRGVKYNEFTYAFFVTTVLDSIVACEMMLKLSKSTSIKYSGIIEICVGLRYFFCTKTLCTTYFFVLVTALRVMCREVNTTVNYLFQSSRNFC